MTAEQELARFVTNCAYDDLYPDAVEATKRDILDTIGVGLAGACAPGVGELVDFVHEMAGKPSSTVLSDGTLVPPTNAALVNGSMCHAFDFDDTHDKAVLHTGAVIIPAALATAEYIGHVSGREFINAVALGIEVHCRLGLATRLWIGWMLTPLYGYFGAAAAAGKMLGLDEAEMLNAWGIAYSQAAGNTEMIASGALTKRIQAGFASSGGVLASLLARRHITGAENSLLGRAGIFNLYQRGDYDEAALTVGLGKDFEVRNLSFKPYPCCRFNHSCIEASLDIARETGIEPERIAEVVVHVSTAGYQNNCEPIKVKRRPRTIVDAQFSAHYGVACALVRRHIGLSDFQTESLQDPLVLDVASRVRCLADPDIDRQAGRGIAPAQVEVRTISGESYVARVDAAKGHPDRPMNRSELVSKFQSCAALGRPGLPGSKVEALKNALLELDQVEDMGVITRLLPDAPG